MRLWEATVTDRYTVVRCNLCRLGFVVPAHGRDIIVIVTGTMFSDLSMNRHVSEF